MGCGGTSVDNVQDIEYRQTLKAAFKLILDSTELPSNPYFQIIEYLRQVELTHSGATGFRLEPNKLHVTDGIARLVDSKQFFGKEHVIKVSRVMMDDTKT